MFCPNCGSQLAEDASFCGNCGTAVEKQAPQQPVYEQPVYQQPVSEQPAPPQPQQPMGWFKFLINFGLWAGAILNILGAIPLLTGSQYGDADVVEMVYEAFEGLQGLDMLSGMLAIALGAFGIYTRYQLAGFKVNAPKMLTILYIGAILSNIIYVVGCNSILPGSVLSEIDFTSFYSNTITSAVMIFVNQAYFKKRADLFIN